MLFLMAPIFYLRVKKMSKAHLDQILQVYMHKAKSGLSNQETVRFDIILFFSEQNRDSVYSKAFT